MSAWGGIVGGVLALSALEAISSNAQASGRIGSLLTGAGNVINHLASPNVPLIPDLRATSGAAPSSAPATPTLSIPALKPSTRIPAPATPTLSV